MAELWRGADTKPDVATLSFPLTSSRRMRSLGGTRSVAAQEYSEGGGSRNPGPDTEAIDISEKQAKEVLGGLSEGRNVSKSMVTTRVLIESGTSRYCSPVAVFTSRQGWKRPYRGVGCRPLFIQRLLIEGDVPLNHFLDGEVVFDVAPHHCWIQIETRPHACSSLVLSGRCTPKLHL